MLLYILYFKSWDVLKDFYFLGMLGVLVIMIAVKFYFGRLKYRRAVEMEGIKEDRLDRFDRMKRNKLKEFDRLKHEEIYQN